MLLYKCEIGVLRGRFKKLRIVDTFGHSREKCPSSPHLKQPFLRSPSPPKEAPASAPHPEEAPASVPQPSVILNSANKTNEKLNKKKLNLKQSSALVYYKGPVF